MVDIRIEGKVLDVFEGVDFSFNYSIADVRDPNKRNTEYSKTIKCPSTPNNDRLFGQIYDVNISNEYNSSIANVEVNFNPNKKASAVVMSDGVQIMAGVVQLRQITVNQSKMIYEVVFIGKLVDIFSVIADKKINESLDFSDLNHDLTQANIIASWSNTEGYTYPYIDYGSRIEFNNLGRVFYPTDLRPAIYAKTLFDRIFDFAGFTYTSSFISGSIFSKLIVPFSGENVYADPAQVVSRSFRASLSSATPPYTTSNTVNQSSNFDRASLICDNDSTDGNFDPSNNFTTGQYQAPANGIYNFSAEVRSKLVRIIFSPLRTYDGALKINLRIRKLDLNSSVTTISDSSTIYSVSNNPQPFFQEIELNTSANDVLLFQGETVFFDILIDFSELVVQNLIGQLIDPRNIYTDFELNLQSSTVSCDAIPFIFEGDNVLMTSVSPNIQMNDFLVSIFKMFNLYVTVDPLNDNNLLIETRDVFYASGGTKDWTYKLDRKSDITIEPLGVLTDREYIYTYSSDGDYYNSRYENNRGHVYGMSRIEVDNDFVQSSREVSVVFSATPLVNDNPSNRIIPKIYDSDINEGAKPTESNIRILYFNNLPSNPSWILESYVDPSITIATYPYAGHWDNPLTPTLDINFGLPFEIYYQQNSYTGTLQVTNANIYNLYHKNYTEEVTNKDSKVLTGYFNLSPVDINQLDFRDKIVIDNSYWRLNKVMNFNPTKEGLTKVELIKIKDLISFTELQKDIFGDGIIGSEKIPAPSSEIKTNGNKYPIFQGKVSGLNNNVGHTVVGFDVQGKNNFIGEGSTNITIQGNNNFVQSGLHNVTLINTNEAKIFESNVTYVNNAPQACFKVVDGGLNEVRSLKACNPIFIIDGGADIVSNTFAQIGINILDGGLD